MTKFDDTDICREVLKYSHRASRVMQDPIQIVVSGLWSETEKVRSKYSNREFCLFNIRFVCFALKRGLLIFFIDMQFSQRYKV